MSPTVMLGVLQITFIVLFAILGEYDNDKTTIGNKYPMFQDIQVMIFIGFGFLMTFLRKYGYSAVGYNFLLSGLSIQWAILLKGFTQLSGGKMRLGLANVIQGEFAAAAVLISYGALLGRTSPTQLLVMAFLEIMLYQLNEFINAQLLGAVDMGGSMYIHAFGAYYGLAISRKTTEKQKECSTKNEESSYHSDVFSMVGTVFLWMFWPSFNAALAPATSQPRIIINTCFSLAASCVTTFALALFLEKDRKLKMVYIQNSTLAGGVVMGTACDMMIHPHGAMALGILAGMVSTFGFRYLTPWLSSFGVADTCGVNNLHGLPGLVGALCGAVASGFATQETYGRNLYVIFPHLLEGTSISWSNWEQALHQLVALIITLCIACIGGTVVGLLIRQKGFEPVMVDLFTDRAHWETPDDYDPNVPTILKLRGSPRRMSAVSVISNRVSPPEYDGEITTRPATPPKSLPGQQFLTVDLGEERIRVHYSKYDSNQSLITRMPVSRSQSASTLL